MSSREALEVILLERLKRNVRALRLERRLSVRAAAERADMHWRSWQRIEAGEINVTLETLARLSLALGVDQAALLREPPNSVN